MSERFISRLRAPLTLLPQGIEQCSYAATKQRLLVAAGAGGADTKAAGSSSCPTERQRPAHDSLLQTYRGANGSGRDDLPVAMP